VSHILFIKTQVPDCRPLRVPWQHVCGHHRHQNLPWRHLPVGEDLQYIVSCSSSSAFRRITRTCQPHQGNYTVFGASCNAFNSSVCPNQMLILCHSTLSIPPALYFTPTLPPLSHRSQPASPSLHLQNLRSCGAAILGRIHRAGSRGHRRCNGHRRFSPSNKRTPVT